jgi:hypothetical protein
MREKSKWYLPTDRIADRGPLFRSAFFASGQLLSSSLDILLLPKFRVISE